MIPFKLIRRVLNKCATGFGVRLATHSKVIDANGKRYQKFPKHEDIQMSHVKKLFQYLEIDLNCAKQNGTPDRLLKKLRADSDKQSSSPAS